MKLLAFYHKNGNDVKHGQWFFIVEAGDLESIKIRYNFQNEHCYHENGSYEHLYISSTILYE